MLFLYNDDMCKMDTIKWSWKVDYNIVAIRLKKM